MALGLGKGARVGLLAPKGDEWVLNRLAAGRMGALVLQVPDPFSLDAG